MAVDSERENDSCKIYNSRILYNYTKLFREKYPHVNIPDLLDFAGIEQADLEDPLEWFTQEQHNRFFERMSTYFDNPYEIAREAGRFVYSDKVLGLFKQFSLKLLGVGVAYKNIAKYGSALSRSSTFSSREIASNKYEVTVKLNDSIVESPHQEYNRLGIMEAAPLMFSDKMAKVESIIEGNIRKYIITWAPLKSEVINKYKSIFLIGSPALILLLGLLGNPGIALHSIYAAIFIYLLLEVFHGRFKYKELDKLHQSHEVSVDKIIQTYIEDYEQVNILNRIGRIILRYVANDNYLSDIAKTLKELKYDKVAFFISNFSNDHIVCKLNQGYKDDIRGLELDAKAIEPHNKSLLEPQLIEAAGSPIKGLPIDLNQYFDLTDYPLIFVPIVYDIAALGFFFTSPEKSIQPIKKKKINFLTGVASQIALGIHKQQAFDEIAESDRIKTEFIATASHELKTPIQAMMLGLDELELSRDIDLNLPPLKKVTSKLADEINNLLSLHRIESKRYSLAVKKFRPIKIFEYLEPDMQNSALVFAHAFKSEGFETDGPAILGDIDKLARAFMNLFNNSCKYTPKGGKIIFKYELGHNEHRLSIIDNGLGIAKGHQNKVFIKFYQISNSLNDSVGGIGLGLSIVKEIINLHNGDITILSPLPSNQYDIQLDSIRLGTCMTIHLPLSE